MFRILAHYTIMFDLKPLIALCLLFAFAACLPQPELRAPGCNIIIPKLSPQAIVVSQPNNAFLYPEPEDNSIFIPQNGSVTIACPGGTLSYFNRTIDASCISDSVFQSGLHRFDFNELKCSREPFHTARYTGKSCESNGREIEIGFILSGTSFARQQLICFDETTLTAFYSVYNLTRSIRHHESGVPRPSFIEDNFYNLGRRVNDLYVRAGQKKTINTLLGLPENSTKWIKDTGNFYLARGHLTAKADFVYASQQSATFHYVNVAPQWQTFNGDNWNTAEMNVRAYAEKYSLDLVVYTGTFGVTTLPHEQTGREVPLYLYTDTKNALPVPRVYWKVVYDPARKLGVALVGINNPYLQNLDGSILCTDIQNTISWISWKATDLQAGYSYACTVPDLKRRVPFLPALDVQGVLL